MRRLIASALVLLPILAHGQAATLQASATMPAGLHAAAAAAAKPAAAPTADEVLVPVNETVVDRTTPDANDVNTSFTTEDATPKLLQTTPIVYSLADMRSSSTVSVVTVHLTVGRDGVPTNLSIVQSGGAALDRRALEAVAQYRFKPATHNAAPVDSQLEVQIKVKKS
jgi:TonB family protein